jgi:hypothetical protein
MVIAFSLVLLTNLHYFQELTHDLVLMAELLAVEM